MLSSREAASYYIVEVKQTSTTNEEDSERNDGDGDGDDEDDLVHTRCG